MENGVTKQKVRRLWMVLYSLGVFFLIAGLLLNVVVLPVQADWDGSDLAFTNSCSGNCEVIQATICNNGAAMQGTTTFQVLWKASGSARTGVVVHSGIVPVLPAGQCAVLSFNPLSVSNPPEGYPLGNFVFRAQQRPDYVGNNSVIFSGQCRPFKDADECRLPTPTPTFTFTPTNTPVSPTATFTFTPTNTPVTPTATFTFTPTNTPVTPTATFTFTPTPQDTEEPTPTPVTPTPQETVEITATSVVRTPVDTPPAEGTLTPEPTDQPPPPATLAPPPPSTTVLIPVTGGTLIPPVQALLKTLFTYLGLLMLGAGMVVQGANRWMR